MPCDYSRYHPDWKWIRKQILDQADNRCEFCGVLNYAVGARDRFGKWHDEDAIHGMNSTDGYLTFGDFPDMIRIVLTVAHVADPDPMNIDPSNLRALCQLCHNRHDAPMRQEHARETRHRKKLERTGQMELVTL